MKRRAKLHGDWAEGVGAAEHRMWHGSLTDASAIPSAPDHMIARNAEFLLNRSNPTASAW